MKSSKRSATKNRRENSIRISKEDAADFRKDSAVAEEVPPMVRTTFTELTNQKIKPPKTESKTKKVRRKLNEQGHYGEINDLNDVRLL